MNQELQELEDRLTATMKTGFAEAATNIKAVEGRLNDNIEAVEGRLNGSIEAVEGRLNGSIEAAEGRLNGSIAAVNQRVGVLHEAAMAQFKVSLEAIHGTSEILSKHIDKRTDAIQSDLALVKKAVKANQAESLADRARRD